MAAVRAIHAASIVDFGGALEIRGPDFLESAFDRPRNLLAAVAFLDLNGQCFRPDEAEAFAITMALASGEIDESSLAAWFSEFSAPKER